MYFLEWNNNYESNIPLIDSQHKALFKAINIFCIKCKFGHEKDAALGFTNFFENFTLSHFQTEEAYQRESKYPAANEHEAKHDFIKIKVKRIVMRLENSNYSSDSLEELATFTLEYLREHIEVDDYKFIQYIKNLPPQK